MMILIFLFIIPDEDSLYYQDVPMRPVSSLLPGSASLSRSVPGIPAATQQQQPEHKTWQTR